uniref:DNA replication complex GINS protein SLD5 n=1 Tax=Ascaris suum TaxID=6253 RepID=F1LCS8_ASCSU
MASAGTEDGASLELVNLAQGSSAVQIDESDEEAVTPAEVLAKLTIAWQNEVCAPRLLPHRFDLLECIIDQIEGMEENISRTRCKNQLKVSLHKMELHRVGYIASHYMRKRLQKIEVDAANYLAEDNARRRDGKGELLSEQERIFAEKYARSQSTLQMKCALSRLPPALQRLPLTKVDVSRERVFIDVVEDDVQDVSVPDMTDPLSELIIHLDKGSTHLIPYQSVAEHLSNDKIRLL